MEECTFSPVMHQSATTKALKNRIGDRTAKSQHKIQEEFLAKKEQWVAQKRGEKEYKETIGMQKTFMSKGSQKIIREKSMNKSNSQSNFLERNYYNHRDKSRNSNYSGDGGSRVSSDNAKIPL